MIHSDLCLLTGPIGIGKTTLLINLFARVDFNIMPIKGIVTPNYFVNGELKGKLIKDISTGEEKSFALLNPENADGRRNLRFTFNWEVISWANSLFDEVSSSSNMVVDEIGPLEIVMNSGLTSALKMIQERRFRKGLVVIRPDMIDLIRASWQVNTIMELVDFNSSGQILKELLYWFQSPCLPN